MTYFNPSEYVTAVRGEEIVRPYAYLVGTAHRRGFAELPSAAGGLNRDVWSVALVSLGLAFVATLYPSWRAARVNPAEALRYE